MRLRSGVFASACLLVQALGVGLFLRGFFPVPVRSLPRSGALAGPPAEPPPTGFSSNWTKVPSPVFKKTVIVLIDALRDDFVFGSKGKRFMPYTTQLVERGTSHSFVAEANAPTVTMPRIKALTTGSIPGFIDVIMNLNSPALLEDNLIQQAKAAGKRIIFYGDDTWVRLFPKQFVEYDGTTSFFVSDYTEVDDNVTRHLDNVMKREDWDLLILHYLGLDHIGHLSGPHSPLIGPKLSEMDNIIKKIHTSLLSKEEGEVASPHLLVVCGDHGMSETGSHGGSSEGEVRTPLLFVSSAFDRAGGLLKPPELVQQTDLAVTLAIGLGLPISRNSVGQLLLPVVQQKTVREQLRYLHLNGFQLSRLLQENMATYEKDPGFQQFKMVEKSHGSWLKLYLEGNTSEVLRNLGKKVLRQYLEAIRVLSSSLSKQVAQYDTYSMIVGTVIILEVLVLLLLSTAKALSSRAELEVPLSLLCSLLFYLTCLMLCTVHVVVCTSAESSCYFCSISWLTATGVIVLISGLLCVVLSALENVFVNPKLMTKNPAAATSSWSEFDVLILAGTIGHVSSLGASSFIEEEHQTWYFLVSTLCLALCQETCRHCFLAKDCDLQLPSSSKADPENVKGAHHHRDDAGFLQDAPKTGKAANSESTRGSEKWMVLATPWVVLICCRLLRSLNQTGVQWAHKPDFGHWLTRGIIEARFVYVFVLGIVFTGTKDLLKSQVLSTDAKTKFIGLWEIYSGLVLLAALLLRPHNLPVLVFCLLIQAMMTKYVWKPLEFDAAQVTIMHYWFGQAFFFFQGNSNSIASVDVSAGFVGLDNYVEIPAIFLTGFATYSGPLLWAIHLLCYLSSEVSRNPSAMGHGCFCYALLRSIPVAVYIILVTGLRYHLFIWSVFSPKLLYEGVHVFITAAVCTFFTAMDHNHLRKVQD
ncbi:GPI ethanolamine phosphate transferase 2 isoform X2 [Zootoca vivipara]|uniref:GPI ethanolamine phosphate transferase 2 isoform X2 n=1 Tax=Zootoca vivipara TaxID=8524 RepID=UPI00293BBD1E|nr:GPI ethanolamine phosphate transferase 2 isoform X2 [Zootoca vivipara]